METLAVQAKRIKIGRRVSLGTSTVLGTVVDTHVAYYGTGRVKKYSAWVVKWDSGRTGHCEDSDLTVIE
jgi:hypothetical protein